MLLPTYYAQNYAGRANWHKPTVQKVLIHGQELAGSILIMTGLNWWTGAWTIIYIELRFFPLSYIFGVDIT